MSQDKAALERDLTRSEKVKSLINALIQRIKGGDVFSFTNGTIQISLPESRAGAEVLFIPASRWGNDSLILRYGASSAGGFALQNGTVVIKADIPETKSASKLAKLLADKNSRERSLLVHELTHEIDHVDGRIPKSYKSEAFVSTEYFRQGWEQEARFQELLADLERFAVEKTVTSFTWVGTRSSFWPPETKVMQYIQSKSHSAFVAWPHLTSKGKSRILTRLIDAYPIVVNACVKKVKRDIAKARRTLAAHSDIMSDMDNLEVNMLNDKAIQAQLTKLNAVAKQLKSGGADNAAVDVASRGTLYHTTDSNKALSILEDKAFIGQLSNAKTSEASINQGWYVSLSRSKVSSYQRTSSGAVWFVLDGDILAANHKVKPVAYWGQRISDDETEERLTSRKQYIPLGKSVKEVWLFQKTVQPLEHYDAKMIVNMRKIAILAARMKIKVRLFDPDGPKSQLPRGSVPLSRLAVKTDAPNPFSRMLTRGMGAYDYEDYLAIRALVTKSKLKDLNKRADKYVSYPMDMPGFIVSATHNAKSPGAQARYAELFKLTNTTSSQQLAKYLQEKWYRIREKDSLLDSIATHNSRMEYYQAIADNPENSADRVKDALNDIRSENENYRNNIVKARELGVTKTDIDDAIAGKTDNANLVTTNYFSERDNAMTKDSIGDAASSAPKANKSFTLKWHADGIFRLTKDCFALCMDDYTTAKASVVSAVNEKLGIKTASMLVVPHKVLPIKKPDGSRGYVATFFLSGDSQSKALAANTKMVRNVVKSDTANAAKTDTATGGRKLTLAMAKARYVYRFTMDHVPAWAMKPMPNGKYPAPQYKSDIEWYDKTTFPGEKGVSPNSKSCMSREASWPLGKLLDEPFKMRKTDTANNVRAIDTASIKSTVETFLNILMEAPVGKTEAEWPVRPTKSDVTVLNSLVKRIEDSQRFLEFTWETTNSADGMFVKFFKPSNMTLAKVAKALAA